MVTKRLPVNIPNVNWYNGQQVTKAEMLDEQYRNINIDASNIANFFGSGVLKNYKTLEVILDTNNLTASQETFLKAGNFDGSILVSNIYPSNRIEGVQLSISLTNVGEIYRNIEWAPTRILIIGDEFGDNLIYDELTFYYNCTKITRNRYKYIRSIIFNDFAGNLHGSVNNAYDIVNEVLYGNCIIREVDSLEVSTDVVIASQTKQPSKFFYNFIPAEAITLNTLLQQAIGNDKSLDDLNMSLTSASQRAIEKEDVTTRIGQKFLANGSNIQKISVLLSVEEDIIDGFDWSGYIVLSLHALQTDVVCPVSPIPDNSIDFDPDPSIIAQMSLNMEDLAKQRVILNNIPKIVDFVFTNHKISDPLRSPIETGKYYVFTIGRSGDSHTGRILLEEASNRTENSYMVYFNGSEWTNIVDSDMWFNIEGNYIKVSDGIAYQNGIGVEVPKIEKNELTNTEEPYINGYNPLYSLINNNYVLFEKSNKYSELEEDQRTGNDVNTRVEPAASISLINDSNLTTLLLSDPSPVILANVNDRNPRENPSEINGVTKYIGLVYENEFNILNPDADILNFNLIGSMLYPDIDSNYYFKIIKQTLFNDSYGDVNGDGEITLEDLEIATSFAEAFEGDGYDINDINTQNLISNGLLDIMQFLRADVNGDGKVDSSDLIFIENYINKAPSSEFAPAGNTFTRVNLLVEYVSNDLGVPYLPTNIQLKIPSVSEVPYSEINWKIKYFPIWYSDLVSITDTRRFLTTTFSNDVSLDFINGRNDFYIPGNLLLDGYIKNTDDSFYSIDFEVVHLSLDMPLDLTLNGEDGIELFPIFVAESSNGLTSFGFKALKYSDGTYVQLPDFAAGKVKISVAIQSKANKHYGTNIEDIFGLYYDPITSLMTVYLNDQYDDGMGNLIKSKSLKILISIYLKKSGFRNISKEISKEEMKVIFDKVIPPIIFG